MADYIVRADSVTAEDICHGCFGRGWVTVDGKAQTCPICGGRGRLPYDYSRQPLPTARQSWAQ